VREIPVSLDRLLARLPRLRGDVAIDIIREGAVVASLPLDRVRHLAGFPARMRVRNVRITDRGLECDFRERGRLVLSTTGERHSISTKGEVEIVVWRRSQVALEEIV
jgi:hypothetical protein